MLTLEVEGKLVGLCLFIFVYLSEHVPNIFFIKLCDLIVIECP